MRNSGSTTFRADFIDRGHDSGHTTVPVRKYVVEEKEAKEKEEEEETEEPMCVRHGEEVYVVGGSTEELDFHHRYT